MEKGKNWLNALLLSFALLLPMLTVPLAYAEEVCPAAVPDSGEILPTPEEEPSTAFLYDYCMMVKEYYANTILPGAINAYRNCKAYECYEVYEPGIEVLVEEYSICGPWLEPYADYEPPTEEEPVS